MFGNKDWDDFRHVNKDKKIVTVNINGIFNEGKKLYVELDWELENVLRSASQRLEIPLAKRIFNADGVEVDDCMMIEDDDILFLSDGEDFISPLDDIEDDNDVTESREKEGTSSNLPTSIGGYKVTDFLGKGAFGEVRLGEHPLNDERVALKFVNKKDILTISAAERTMTEIQCLATLKHPNIITLYQHVETPSHVVLIFELMNGGDLLSHLINRGPTPQEMALPEDTARSVFLQLVNAVSYAHNQHICHRDLKLENILLKHNSLEQIKVADFGLSDFYRPGTTRKSNCGTLSFLAPEGLRSGAKAGPPLDVWSLGVILFSVLCGRLPFEGNLNSTQRPRDQVIRNKIMKCQYRLDDSLGIEVKDLIRRMLKLDPGERASVPELNNHIWVKTGNMLMDDSFPSGMTRNRTRSRSRGNSDLGLGADGPNDSLSPSSPAQTTSKKSISIQEQHSQAHAGSGVRLTGSNANVSAKREMGTPTSKDEKIDFDAQPLQSAQQGISQLSSAKGVDFDFEPVYEFRSRSNTVHHTERIISQSDTSLASNRLRSDSDSRSSNRSPGTKKGNQTLHTDKHLSNDLSSIRTSPRGVAMRKRLEPTDKDKDSLDTALDNQRLTHVDSNVSHSDTGGDHMKRAHTSSATGLPGDDEFGKSSTSDITSPRSRSGTEDSSKVEHSFKLMPLRRKSTPSAPSAAIIAAAEGSGPSLPDHITADTSPLYSHSLKHNQSASKLGTLDGISSIAGTEAGASALSISARPNEAIGGRSFDQKLADFAAKERGTTGPSSMTYGDYRRPDSREGGMNSSGTNGYLHLRRGSKKFTISPSTSVESNMNKLGVVSPRDPDSIESVSDKSFSVQEDSLQAAMRKQQVRSGSMSHTDTDHDAPSGRKDRGGMKAKYA